MSLDDVTIPEIDRLLEAAVTVGLVDYCHDRHGAIVTHNAAPVYRPITDAGRILLELVSTE